LLGRLCEVGSMCLAEGGDVDQYWSAREPVLLTHSNQYYSEL